MHIDLVILDESQSFRSQSSNRFKAMRRLRKLIPRMVQLTGTPSPNGYKNLWAQMYLLDQGQRLGGTEEAYHSRWFDSEQAYPGSMERRKVLKPGAKAEIEERISDLVLAMRADDYLDLPPVRYNVVKVDLSESEMKTYKRLEREAQNRRSARGGTLEDIATPATLAPFGRVIEIVFKAHAYQCSQGHQTWVWLVDGEDKEPKIGCPACRSAYLSALKL